jgi:hypothetical protein
MFTVLTSCSNTALKGAMKPSPKTVKHEIKEARQVALDAEDWTTLAPGFRYRNHHGGVAFWITAPELTADSIQRVEAHIHKLSRTATSDIEKFRLGEWKKALTRARSDHVNWQTYWPKIVKEHEQAVGKGLIPQVASCIRFGASAMPTTAAPGAKAYAEAECSASGFINGYVHTETSAHAASDWPPACQDDATFTSQCNSVAYGNQNCHSAAFAEYYYKFSSVVIDQDTRSDSNDYCT